MTALASYAKQPAEVIDYDIDYAEYFATDDRIDSTGVPAEPRNAYFNVSSVSEVTPTLVVDSTYVIGEGKVLKLWVSGGTNGVSYKVTARVTSTGGRVKEVEFKVKVRDT